MAAAASPAVDPGEKRLIDRMLYFSDAVFAIALTLLALELRAPAGTDAHWGDEIAARFTVFLMSFALIAVFWAGHMIATRRLIRFDWIVCWINLFFLFAIVLMPFGTSLFASRVDPADTWRLYSYIVIGASVAQSALSLALNRDGGKLVGGASFRDVLARFLRAVAPAIAFAGGLVLVDRGQLDLARWCGLAIFPMVILAGIIAPRRPKSK